MFSNHSFIFSQILVVLLPSRWYSKTNKFYMQQFYFKLLSNIIAQTSKLNYQHHFLLHMAMPSSHTFIQNEQQITKTPACCFCIIISTHKYKQGLSKFYLTSTFFPREIRLFYPKKTDWSKQKRSMIIVTSKIIGFRLSLKIIFFSHKPQMEKPVDFI